jgi:glycosyltransferase involved in cell wall biosynthesis
MVQVEAMVCGTVVVATDLPGVRQPVHTTGMGRIVPRRDSAALARAIVDLLRQTDGVDAVRVSKLAMYYSPKTVAEAYESIYQDLIETDE